MTVKHLVGLLVLVLCSACGSSPETTQAPWLSIHGRDLAVNDPIYRARVPDGWQRQAPVSEAQREDTMQPICRFIVPDNEGPVEITVHNFPTDSIDERIPPAAQVARWQRQVGARASAADLVQPIAHAGFVGLSYAADGVMAWSLQLAKEHYQALSMAPDSRLKQQMRADYTIKATGPEASLARHQREITAFARSFELIEEIPVRDR